MGQKPNRLDPPVFRFWRLNLPRFSHCSAEQADVLEDRAVSAERLEVRGLRVGRLLLRETRCAPWLKNGVSRRGTGRLPQQPKREAGARRAPVAAQTVG